MTDQAWARAEDARDPLRALQARFAHPIGHDGQPLLYLCGQSLGLAPLAARECVAAELADWERLGALGHEEARSPWIGYAEQLQAPLAQLCGASAPEVVAMNSLSINLHLLLASFYRPVPDRGAVLIEAGAFSSDRHIVASQIAWHGLDPARALRTPRAPRLDSTWRIRSATCRCGCMTMRPTLRSGAATNTSTAAPARSAAPSCTHGTWSVKICRG
jgi:kynureninase